MRATIPFACVCALASGCGDARPTGPDELRFQAPTLVLQAPAGALRSVWLAEGGGGRVYAIAGGALPDGREGAYVIERSGDNWGAAVPWPLPNGASAERVAWVGAWPRPIALTLATGPAGEFVAARTFSGTTWSAPVPVTIPGAERAVIARAAEGNPRARAATGAPFDIVYGVASSVCPGGVELRHRRGDGSTWGDARILTVSCGVSALSAATSVDALAVAWVGGGAGSPASARDVYAVTARAAGTAVTFGAPSLLQRGANRDVSVAPLGEGAFLLGWAQRGTGPDGAEAGLQRGAWARFDASARAWSRLDTGWFFSRTAPVLRGDGVGTALALASEGDFPTSPLVLRRWRETAAVSERSGVGGPLGEVTSMSFLRMADGSVEVIWLEAMSAAGVSRVVWTRGVRVVSREAGV